MQSIEGTPARLAGLSTAPDTIVIMSNLTVDRPGAACVNCTVRREITEKYGSLSAIELTVGNSRLYAHDRGGRFRMKLNGKVAFITGFGSGLGQAIAVMFAKQGAAVAGTSTTESKGKETVALIEKGGGKAWFRAGDVGDSEQMTSFIAATVQQYGGLDIVVNSAGVRTNGRITEISEEAWDRTLDTNLKGAFVVSRFAIPEMKKRGGGVILHIAARSGMLGQAGRAAYCASKGGLVRLTEAMAMDHAKDKIRVNCICPGPIRTPMVDTSTPEKLARYTTRVPLGRIGEPDDVAYAALYLASDEASYVTAAILPVDAGMRLTGP
jgi:NAD(P)-dependent dehydrogenase (short-subunit alcohol dehydrogenase family)